MSRSVVLALAVQLVVACTPAAPRVSAPTAAAPLEQRIAGCYELVPGPWRSDSLLSSVFPVRLAPTRFRLMANRAPGLDPLQSDTLPLNQVEAYPDSGQSRHMFTYWQRLTTAGDSVRVGTVLPMAGVGLVLRPRGQDLHGRIYTFIDVVEAGKPGHVERPVTARRAACPGAKWPR
jgi:hypothetical protein